MRVVLREFAQEVGYYGCYDYAGDELGGADCVEGRDGVVRGLHAIHASHDGEGCLRYEVCDPGSEMISKVRT